MSPEPERPVHLVGTGLDPARLPPEAQRIVDGAELLIGGRRLLEALPDHPARKVIIRAPVTEALGEADRESRKGRRVVVLADGDPGFFGIGKRLVRVLGAERVVIHPNVSVLQAAAARIKATWEDVCSVSLHGRSDLWPLRRALARGRRVGVLTDAVFTPARIARDLLGCGVDGYRMHVFEDLGLETERVRAFEDLGRAAGETCSALSFILLEPMRPPRVPLAAGLDDDLLIHENGLITKREVRSVGLGLLGPGRDHVVWDLGAGSGAVALEASIWVPQGKVFAVERDPERVEQIRRNVRRTGAYGVEPVQGEMPDCLEALPDPDRVFLGGGVRREGVLEQVTARLHPGGRVVAHAVLLGSLQRALEALEQAGWSPAVTQVQVARSRPLSGDLRLEALNPVFVVSAGKPM